MNLEELRQLKNENAKRFLHEHLQDDPQKFALKYSSRKDLPIRAIAEQIKNFNKAKLKFPSLSNLNLIYESVAVEQSSSEIAAKFKAKLFKGKKIIDLTGGLGIDSIFFSQKFAEVIYCEQKEILCKIFEHNLNELNIKNIQINCGNSIEHLNSFKENYFDLIYVDPARRDKTKRIISLQNSAPDVVELQNLLLQKSPKVLIKASPALEIEEAIKQLKFVSNIFVVSIDNECKEVLILLDENHFEEIRINAVLLNSKNDEERIFTINHSEKFGKIISDSVDKYFYEPDSAIIKSRLTYKIATEMNMKFINSSVDFLTSKILMEDFPGRIFKVSEVQNYNAKKLKQFFKENKITKANISRREFPLSPDEIKTKFNLKDGGDNYFFFTKNFSGELIFVRCFKIARLLN